MKLADNRDALRAERKKLIAGMIATQLGIQVHEVSSRSVCIRSAWNCARITGFAHGIRRLAVSLCAVSTFSKATPTWVAIPLSTI